MEREKKLENSFIRIKKPDYISLQAAGKEGY
jgi:hypothetical protein